MKITGKWISVTLTAVLVAANLSMPFTSLTAFASDTASAAPEYSSESVEASGAALNSSDTSSGASDQANDADSAENTDATNDAEDADSQESSDQDSADPQTGQTEEDTQAEETEEDTRAEETEEDTQAGETEEDTQAGETEEDTKAGENGQTGAETQADEDTQTEADTQSSEEQSAEEAGGTQETQTDAATAAQSTADDPAQDAQQTADTTDETDEDAVITAEPLTESIIPIEELCEDTDNDDVFAAYVNQELGLTGDLKADTGDLDDSSDSKEKNYASTRLTGTNRTAYANLLQDIQAVAAGERTDTVFTLTTEDLGFKGVGYTASELGVSSITYLDTTDNKTKITEEAKTALDAKLNLSLKAVLRALLLDCPYDLYWYDKTEGTDSTGFGYTTKYVNGEYELYYSDKYEYTFYFYVSADYSASGETGTCETDSSIGSAVSTARDKAASIVSQYSSCSDYEKLDGYRKEICDLTSYNYTAANDNTTDYGNPWQLIWVFDGDSSTKVVCEGYSKSFQYLCDLSEWNDIFLECISVNGYLNGGAHMWNIVALRDDRSYLADITNCDSGMIGSGNSGRNLFLVGTGDADADEIYAQGNIDDGYTFAQLNSLSYVYRTDSSYNMREYFDDEILTLAEGRVDQDTTADGEYTSDHTHIYVNIPEVAATCTEDGHSAYGQCSICGEYDDSYEIYPATGHTAGEWTVTTEPTYDEAGEETAYCSSCGEKMTRSIDPLVSETSISLDLEEAALTVGSTQQLTATVLPSDAYNQSVTWSTDDSSVATVSDSGLVTAAGNGTAVITATTAHLGLTATCTVTVTTPVTGINIIRDSVTIMAGSTFSGLYVILYPSSASDRRYRLISSDESVVTITSTGGLYGVGAGTATVTARSADGHYTDTCTVHVIVPVTSVSLDKTSATIAKGDTLQLNHTIVPSDATDQSVTWQSDYPDIASVSQTGLVTAKAQGTATITVVTADGGYSATCTVTVIIPVTGVSLDYDTLTLDLNDENGKSATLKATINPNNATNQNISWSSDNDNVATVDSDGTVTAQEQTGTATITVTTEDGTYTDTCEVTVIKQQEQTITANDIEVTMFDNESIAVEGVQTAVTYTSSDTSIFTVDQNGIVTPVKPGTAELTIFAAETEEYYAASKTITVTVSPMALTDSGTTITLSPASFTYNGKEKKPSVTSVVDANGRTLVSGTDYTVSYSNNINAGSAAKVTINGTGNYTGSAVKTFTINKAAQSLTLKASASSIKTGTSTKVTASGAKETSKYTFTSSNTAVATVNSAGTVTGKKPGTVTITVRTPATANYKAGSKTVKITVSLKKPGNCHFVKWNNSKYTSCRIGWNAVSGAAGYQTLLSWTDGSHASTTIVKSNVLYRDCTVHPQHVSQMMVRAYYTVSGVRKYGPWSNVEYITPSPTKLTKKNTSTSSSSLQMQVSWNIIYGCNGYNVFLTTNPNGTWYWNQSTAVNARATKATIKKYRSSKLKKYQNYYVRIVTRRMRKGVFCTVPMPAQNTNIGYFVFK